MYSLPTCFRPPEDSREVCCFTERAIYFSGSLVCQPAKQRSVESISDVGS